MSSLWTFPWLDFPDIVDKFMCERGWRSSCQELCGTFNCSDVKKPRYPRFRGGNVFPDQAVWSSAALIYLWQSRHSHPPSLLPTDDDLWTDVCIATAPLRLHTVAVMGCFCFVPLSFDVPLLLSTSPGIPGSHSSSPLCSGMASGKQSIIFWPSAPPLSFPSPSHTVHSSQFGGDYVF